MTPLECEKCRGPELLTVTRVVERGRDRQWQPLGWFDQVQPMSVTICCGCNHAVWYTQATATALVIDGRSERLIGKRRCRDCLTESHLVISSLQETTTRGSPMLVPLAPVAGELHGGQFAVVVCDGCGRAEWYAYDVRLERPLAERGMMAGDCEHCHGAELHVVRPLREENGRPLPVAVVDGRPHGEFEVRWCRECGACEWRAHRIADIVIDGSDVVRTSAAAARVPVAGGPYR
jgi:hypothetical protein